MMRALSKVRPGQPGTKKLLGQYGRQMVCVRYRYDAQKRKRYTTVEIIVAEADWSPRARRRPDRPVGLRVEFRETELRRQVKAAGAVWDGRKKLWIIKRDRALALAPAERIVEENL